MKISFKAIIEFNKKFKKQTELKDNKKAQLDKAEAALEKLENKLLDLQEEEVELSADENASDKIDENKAKQETLKEQISKKKEKVVSLRATHEKYQSRYLKSVLEKDSAIYDLNFKIAKLEDQIDEMQQKWSKAAEKLNKNIEQMRGLDRESEEYKALEEENEQNRDIMRNNVITSQAGMKLKNELEEAQFMKRILENGEIIEELAKDPEPVQTKQTEEQSPAKESVQEEVEEQEISQPEEQIQEEIIDVEQQEPKIQTQNTEKRTQNIYNPVQNKYKQTPNINNRTVQKEEPEEPIKQEETEEIKFEKPVKPKQKPYSEMTIEELKNKQSELFGRIVEDDEYLFRAHKENGMEGYEEDDIDKELKAIREELEKREEKDKEPKLQWHPKLTEEQIMYAKENDIYEPIGTEYEQFLVQLGINKEAEKIEPEIPEEPLTEKEVKESFGSKLKKFFKNMFEDIMRRVNKQKLLPEGKVEPQKRDTSFVEKVRVSEEEAIRTVEESTKGKELEEQTK